MQQTAVEWLAEQLEQKWLTGYLSPISIQSLLLQAKELERQQLIDELKRVGNYFDVSKLDTLEQKHHIRFTSIIRDRIEYHNSFKINKPISTPDV
jgi:hypothetical protein